jgi:hypothetical protein
MDLNRYSAEVEEIINEAIQEGKIENELVKIDVSWRENFLGTVHDYSVH